jgi:hypothetical protein
LEQQIAGVQAALAEDPTNEELGGALRMLSGELVQASVARGILLGIIGNEDFATLVAAGPVLTKSVDDAVKGIRSGLIESGMDHKELASANPDLLDGSAEIRSGTSELASGVRGAQRRCS